MSNNTNFITTVDIVFASLYSFIVFFGVLGNVIIITIVRKTPSMHTTTNFLLTNLAVADLISLLFCPGFYDFALKSVSLSQPIGDFVCKIFVGNAVLSITILESIFMLVVVAVERYVALVKPFQTNSRLRKENVSFAIAATWTLATLVCIPGILSNNYDERAEKYPCNRPWTLNNLEGLKKAYISVFCLVFMIVPAVVILICYLRIFYGVYFLGDIYRERTGDVEEKKSRKHLLKLLASLVAAFVICCMPFAVFFLYVSFVSQVTIIENFDTLHLIHKTVRFLLILNSFVNPLLYAAQSRNYRQGFKRLFCCLSRENANKGRNDLEMKNQGQILKHQSLCSYENTCNAQTDH